MLKKSSVLILLLLILPVLACGLFPETPETESVTVTPVPTASTLPQTLSPTLSPTAVAPPPTSTSPPLPNTPEPTITPGADVVRTIVPTSNVLPTATSLPLPLIASFNANVSIADPGDTVQFSWETRNGDWVTLYRIWDYRFSDFWDVAASGVMSYTISENERNSATFMLFSGREGIDESVQATVTIALTCPDTWFFSPAPDGCPRATLYSEGAEQSFENGVMIWVKERDQIYVLFSDSIHSPKWNSYTDTWGNGDPIDDPDIEPPPGFYQPVRGFGLVWREELNVRERLGWATAPERAFTTAYQTTSWFKYNETYLRALDGNVWRLLPERSKWEKITVTD